MSDDQLELLAFGDSAPSWVPTTPSGRKPANEYELFLALRPDVSNPHGLLCTACEQLQQQKRTATSKLLRPSVWHITVLELGKFTGTYPGDALKAIEAACSSVTRPPVEVTHEGLVSFKPSGACVLTCSSDTQQAVAQLRQDLLVALRGRGVKCKSVSTSHMTLFYDRARALPETALAEPLTWTADGFSLLCSHKGLGHHEVVRHWGAKR